MDAGIKLNEVISDIGQDVEFRTIRVCNADNDGTGFVTAVNLNVLHIKLCLPQSIQNFLTQCIISDP